MYVPSTAVVVVATSVPPFEIATVALGIGVDVDTMVTVPEIAPGVSLSVKSTVVTDAEVTVALCVPVA